jgi:hypothetical protein
MGIVDRHLRKSVLEMFLEQEASKHDHQSSFCGNKSVRCFNKKDLPQGYEDHTFDGFLKCKKGDQEKHVMHKYFERRAKEHPDQYQDRILDSNIKTKSMAILKSNLKQIADCKWDKSFMHARHHNNRPVCTANKLDSETPNFEILLDAECIETEIRIQANNKRLVAEESA